MALTIAVFVASALALWLGGEQFVRGATRVATLARIPGVLVGVIVAGFGTSAPEASVSVLASARGEGPIAIGNALGSNVANILLVLPISLLIALWAVRAHLVRREVIAVFVATAAVVWVAGDGAVSRFESIGLLLLFAVTVVWIAREAMQDRDREELEAEYEALVSGGSVATKRWQEGARTLVGLAIIVVAADRLVWAASRLAVEAGLSRAAVGLTIVAVGTSLPEVVTAAVAARRGQPDLILGNVLGSNIFNALLIVGLAGVIGPLDLPAAERPVALTIATVSVLFLVPFMFRGFRPRKWHAVLALVVYACALVLLYR